jgi:hypothetical protein
VEFNFERFTFGGGRFTPKVSIRSNGILGLSQGLLHRAKIQDDKWFSVLFFDRSAKAIGIKITRDENEEGATRLVYRETGEPKNVTGSIAGKAFLNYYEIPHDKTASYEADWNEEKKMITFRLENK